MPSSVSSINRQVQTRIRSRNAAKKICRIIYNFFDSKAHRAQTAAAVTVPNEHTAANAEKSSNGAVCPIFALHIKYTAAAPKSPQATETSEKIFAARTFFPKRTLMPSTAVTAVNSTDGIIHRTILFSLPFARRLLKCNILYTKHFKKVCCHGDFHFHSNPLKGRVLNAVCIVPPLLTDFNREIEIFSERYLLFGFICFIILSRQKHFLKFLSDYYS